MHPTAKQCAALCNGIHNKYLKIYSDANCASHEVIQNIVNEVVASRNIGAVI